MTDPARGERDERDAWGGPMANCCVRCGFGGTLTQVDPEDHPDAWLCARCEIALDDGEWSFEDIGWRRW